MQAGWMEPTATNEEEDELERLRRENAILKKESELERLRRENAMLKNAMRGGLPQNAQVPQQIESYGQEVQIDNVGPSGQTFVEPDFARVVDPVLRSTGSSSQYAGSGDGAGAWSGNYGGNQPAPFPSPTPSPTPFPTPFALPKGLQSLAQQSSGLDDKPVHDVPGALPPERPSFLPPDAKHANIDGENGWFVSKSSCDDYFLQDLGEDLGKKLVKRPKNNPGLGKDQFVYYGFVSQAVDPASGYGSISEGTLADHYPNTQAFFNLDDCPWVNGDV